MNMLEDAGRRSKVKVKNYLFNLKPQAKRSSNLKQLFAMRFALGDLSALRLTPYA
jgi:hypothetical protein